MRKIRIKLKTDLAKEVFPHQLSKSELRQLQIIEQSIALCAQGGLEALSYGKIAQACGVTRHLVIHYFPNRDVLIEQAMEYVWASLKLWILKKVDQQKGGPDQKIEAYLSANLEWARENRALATFLIVFLHHASTKKKFRKLNTNLMKLGQERILGLLNGGIEEGFFHPVSNRELEAKDMQLTILGHVVNLLTEDQPFQSETLEKQMITTIMSRLRKSRTRK